MSKYRRIAKIQFENQLYQYFRNVENRKMAFLKYDEDLDAYHYPTVEEVLKLAYCFKNDDSFSFYRRKKKNKRHKLYRFVPKLILGGAALTTTFFLGYNAKDLNIDLEYFKRVLDFQHERVVDEFEIEVSNKLSEENGNEKDSAYEENGTRIRVKCHRADKDKYQKYLQY